MNLGVRSLRVFPADPSVYVSANLALVVGQGIYRGVSWIDLITRILLYICMFSLIKKRIKQKEKGIDLVKIHHSSELILHGDKIYIINPLYIIIKLVTSK